MSMYFILWVFIQYLFLVIVVVQIVPAVVSSFGVASVSFRDTLTMFSPTLLSDITRCYGFILYFLSLAFESVISPTSPSCFIEMLFRN